MARMLEKRTKQFRNDWMYGLCVLVVVGLVAGESLQSAPPTWQVRSPAYFRMDSVALERAFRQARAISPPLESLLISRGTALVAEQYFNGFNVGDLWNIKSASKSILSILVGIALQEEYLDSLDQTIDQFFPEFFNNRSAPEKRQITLRDLITMRAGLETTSFFNYGNWVTSSNWAYWALAQPMVSEPGTRMIYSTGNSHLLSVILTRATGMSTREFAERYLFDPLGIERYIWPQDPQGYYFGGNNMALRPRDMLKIGELYLNNGRFRNEQIVPITWVRESTRRYVQSRFSRHWQGYFWWTDRFAGYRTTFAWGHGGQFILVVPDLELVVVCTSSLTNRPDHGDHNDNILRLLEKYIIPSIEPRRIAARLSNS